MGAPEVKNQALYTELRNRGLSKGEAARIANETPAKKTRAKSQSRRAGTQKKGSAKK